MGIILLVIISICIYLAFSKNKKIFLSNEIETSIEILKRRYAKGELSEQEFERIKKDLE